MGVHPGVGTPTLAPRVLASAPGVAQAGGPGGAVMLGVPMGPGTLKFQQEIMRKIVHGIARQAQHLAQVSNCKIHFMMMR